MWWASVVALAGALLVGCHEGPGDSGADAASGGPETIGVGGTIGTVPGSCQTPGNCQKVVCDGSGGTKSVHDPTDLPTSTTACLVSPACTSMPLAKAFTPAATGTSCSADGVAGKKVCGNTSSAFSGTCVECTADTHCTAGTCNTALATCIPNT